VGSVDLSLECTSTGGTSHCVVSSTDGGAHPNLRINTALLPGLLNTYAACNDNSEAYQSWWLENWLWRHELAPGSLPLGLANPPPSDTGPSFTLRSIANNDVFSCVTSVRQNNTFDGACKAAIGSSSIATEFRFDSELNILTIYERWDCDRS
jgi:hypothetical protein